VVFFLFPLFFCLLFLLFYLSILLLTLIDSVSTSMDDRIEHKSINVWYMDFAARTRVESCMTKSFNPNRKNNRIKSNLKRDVNE